MASLLARTLAVTFSVAIGVASLHCSALVSTAGLADGDDSRGVASIPAANDPDGDAATPPEAGADGGPAQPADAGPCSGDLLTNASHCGACGVACGASTGALCRAGQCVFPGSCKDVFARSPRPPSGVFRLVPGSGAGGAPGPAFDAFCELDPAAQGGGWTLLLKVDGASDVFTYDSALWTDDVTYGAGSPALDTTQAKLGGFSRMPFSELRVGMLDQGAERWVVLPVAAPSLRALFASEYQATNLGRTAWRSLVKKPSTQANCNREGVNLRSDEDGGLRARLGMFFNNETDCASIDSYIAIGASSPPHTGNHAADYMADNGTRETMTFAYVMIR